MTQAPTPRGIQRGRPDGPIHCLQWLACTALLCTLAACGNAGGPTDRAASAAPTSPPRPAADLLTEHEAKARKARLGDLHYQLSIDLASGDEAYAGTAVVRFELIGADQPLTLDLSGATISQLTANGRDLAPDYNGYFITLPASALAAGSNELRIRYQHAYDADGTGLHRFTDPEDGRSYLYTYLWPYYANRLFPAFDQPNLKATFDLEVRAPAGWEVVSTAPGGIRETRDGVATWAFGTTPRMSTYVFSLHAGPYRVWQDTAGEVPVRLLARQSLADYVPVEEWFRVTRGGLAFYAGYFGIPYPFGKYDQLLVPDFNIGAMENIAAVTFSEDFVQRQASNRFERERRAEVILHEMAHMWFGNLVTKDWWNGLWLNESFATLMAQLALIGSTEFTDAWHRFFIRNKQAGYRKDSRVTTHPIEVPVRGTADFFEVFDAITYQKGSSVLKQLSWFVGAENFRRGVAAYLDQHAYGNTVLADFMDAQAAASGRDLGRWTGQWLYQPGFNELSAQVECADGRVTALTLHQSAPPEHPQLRQHRVQVALYELQGGRLLPGPVFDAEIDGATARVDAAAGAGCPAFAFPNHDDWGYARVLLDPAGVDAIRGRIQQLEDPLARSMLVQTLDDMAASGRLPIGDYLHMALADAAAETRPLVLAQLTQSVADSIDLLYRLRPESAATLAGALDATARQAWRAVTAATDPDQAALWFGLLQATGGHPDTQAHLLQLLDGRVGLPGLELSQDRRWQLVLTLAASGAPDVEALIREESLRDGSDRGQKSALAAEAARPLAEVKSQWLEELVSPESELGLARQRAVLGSLFPPAQADLLAPHLGRILAALPALAGRDPYFLSSFVAALTGPVCTEDSVAALGEALAAGGLSSTAGLFLREALQADQECLALREQLRTGTATGDGR